jgi:hypothetical protein
MYNNLRAYSPQISDVNRALPGWLAACDLDAN